MQPGIPTIQPNNFSSQLLARRDAWAKEQGIKADELLIFRKIGNGSSRVIEVKSVLKAAEHSPFEPVTTTNESFCIPSHEAIIDKDAPGGFVQLMYYPGGYFPGKAKEAVRLKGNADENVIPVVPQDDPALYDFLTLTPRLKGGVTAGRTAPQIELLRPNHEVESRLEDDFRQAEVVLRVGTATLDVLQWLAPKLHLPAEAATDQRMRKNFADYAKLSPANAEKLGQLFDADETKTYQHVEKAIAADVVQVNRELGMWVFGANQEAIAPARPDRNTLDQLVDFLLAEPGQTTYKQLLALTDKAGTKKK